MTFRDWLSLSGRKPKEIALELGVSYQAVNHWIRGITVPRGKRLIALENMSGGLVTARSFGLQGENDGEPNRVAQ